jgi:hypothetical protein
MDEAEESQPLVGVLHLGLLFSGQENGDVLSQELSLFFIHLYERDT